MTVYVDNCNIRWDGRCWFHLMSDEPGDEIHNFAVRLGLKRKWFQGDHYDITATKRLIALDKGAIPVNSEDSVVIRKGLRDKIQ